MEKLINITEKALDFIKKSVEEEKCFGYRVNIVSGGCQGMVYELSFVKEIDPSDLVMQEDGVDIYISASAVIFISGMTMDYVSGPMGGNIVFENPNARSRCGCGKSFCSDDQQSACNSGACSSCR
ncbi:MAG: iron-sulfur cluster assembly accessory protein [Holosporaceae bacterium]|jgi:iron-sulfur cluster assembly accessory protein|nr:iron-sulfur cluster assembly accessory protein [Holosporaceae bacterium]